MHLVSGVVYAFRGGELSTPTPVTHILMAKEAAAVGECVAALSHVRFPGAGEAGGLFPVDYRNEAIIAVVSRVTYHAEVTGTP